MDYSQYLRLKQEAANVYLSRTKTVDASLITLQKQQKAAYSGYNNIQTIPYFNGAPVLNNTTFGVPTCSADSPKTHRYTQGYSATNRLSQEGQVSRKAGAALCGDASYVTAPPGIQLLNCSTVQTILTSYNNLAPTPGVLKAYGYGQNHYFPNPDTNSDCSNCNTNKTVYPS